MDRQTLKAMVRGAYDIQKLRMQIGLRLVVNFKNKLGLESGEKEEDGLDEAEQKILDRVRASYKRVTDGIASFPREKSFKGDEIISDYTELCLVDQYMCLLDDEMKHFRRLKAALEHFPIWTKFLSGTVGIGPAMGGIIISEIDIHKAAYPSSIWKYAGLDVAEDGRGRSRRKEHLRTVEYVTKDGEVSERASITFNPMLKTKLMGVLAASFLRAGNEKYSKAYNDYKHRLENHPVYGIVNEAARKKEMPRYAPKGHRHNMALRYMMKIFLIDLYNEWRSIEGLPVAPSYQEAKLGHVHGAAYAEITK